MDIHLAQLKIESKQNFTDFLKLLLQDYRNNSINWENASLEDFLEALLAYTDDLEGFYLNSNEAFDSSSPTWKNFAQILLGARVYE